MGIMKWKCQEFGGSYRIVAEQEMDVMHVARCGYEISVIEWNQASCQRFLLEQTIRWISLEMARISRAQG